MLPSSSRRSFLSSATAAGALVGLGELGFLRQLAPVSAADAAPDPKVVSLRPEIHPLVQLLEESSQDKVLEAVAAKIKAGTSYRDVLTALTLAGVRNIQPRPVGFKFHAVLVVNSAHQASLASPDQHRWLPIFWAIDEFKKSQAEDAAKNNWTMAPVDEAAVPDAAHARAMFTEALDQWDVEKADAAAAGLARHCSLHEAFEILFRYGCRDFRDIGHKAIYVSNSYRTLATIGWQHAEPVLRSLTYALLAYDGRNNPAKSDLPADQPGRRNTELAKQFKPDWNGGKPDDGAVNSLIAVLRSGNEQESCQEAIAALQKGVAVQSIWDALFVTSGEYLMKQPGIVALHAMTSSNALRFAYETAADEQTRRIALLQNVAFLPLFRQAMTGGNKKLGDADLVKLEAAPAGSGGDAIADIFRDVSGKQMSAAQKMLSYLNSGGDAHSLINAARLLIFLKGTNSHDYKFSTAVLEDYFRVSPGWRNRFLASSVFQLRGSGRRIILWWRGRARRSPRLHTSPLVRYNRDIHQLESARDVRCQLRSSIHRRCL